MGRFKRRKSSPNDEQDACLLRHIEVLGLPSVSEYRSWCADHGFSRRLNKTWNERCRERYLVTEAVAQASMKSRRRQAKNSVETMMAICDQSLRVEQIVQPHLRLLAGCVQRLGLPAHQKKLARQALAKLLRSTASVRCGFFHEATVVESFGRRRGNTYVEALVAIATWHAKWRRDLNDWKPRSKNTRRQFKSLVRHLFCDYPLPDFFDSVWFLGCDRTARIQQSWYVRVGTGGSIADCALPIPCTRRMGHFLMHAPAELTLEQAIRWGQLKTFKFSDRQVRALLEISHVGSFQHESFWVTVFRWLAQHPEVEDGDYGPLFDYLYNQRFVDQGQVFGGGDRLLGPPQPNLTMRGRKPSVLLAQMHTWHKQLANDNTRFEASWRSSGFPAFTFVEGEGRNAKMWTIRELLSSKALAVEGRQMSHCVASYVDRCSRGGGSIWTMEVETVAGRKKHLTIELQNSSGRIVQARGRANRRAKPLEMGILRRWATESGLTIGVNG
jgi:hypothetical protein